MDYPPSKKPRLKASPTAKSSSAVLITNPATPDPTKADLPSPDLSPQSLSPEPSELAQPMVNSSLRSKAKAKQAKAARQAVAEEAKAAADAALALPDGWLEIGTIVGVQGLRGEVRVYPVSDFPERFEEAGPRWLLAPKATTPTPVQLVRGRLLPGKALYVVTLEGVENRDQAEVLRQCRLLVPESDRPLLDEGEYHVADLIGLRVIDQATRAEIGTVVDVISAGNDLLQVTLTTPADKPQQVLIPFVPEIVPVVDVAQGFVEITPPPGLLEI